MSGKSNEEIINDITNDSVKELAEALKKVSSDETSFEDIVAQQLEDNTESSNSSEFKVATNLPAKVNTWTKIRNVLFSEIKVELTPYQQKMEDDINNFLHQEITWDSFKGFLFKEVPITYKGKRVF